jgi:hypothetical protein
MYHDVRNATPATREHEAIANKYPISEMLQPALSVDHPEWSPPAVRFLAKLSDKCFAS